MHTQLTDQELVEKTKTLVQEEKKFTCQIIEHLREIDQRKLHLAWGFSSLFEFCTQELGYCAGSAQLRIQAMKLMRELSFNEQKKIEEKIQKGSLSLSHLAQVQSYGRQEGLGVKEKRTLLEKVENTSIRESERLLLKEKGEMRPKPTERIKAISETHSSLTVLLDEEGLKLYERFKELTAHQNPYATPGKVIQLALKVALKKIDPLLQEGRKIKNPKTISAKREVLVHTHGTTERGKENPPSQGELLLHAHEVKITKNSRYISKEMKREVWKRDGGRCQYQDPGSGRKCLSSFMLELDHCVPLSQGGKTEVENLMLLCRNHNAYWSNRLKPKSLI